MRIAVLSVGKCKEAYWRQAVAEYTKRLSRYASMELVEVPDQPAPERYSQAEREEVLIQEGKRILEKLLPRDYVVALCIEGTRHSSTAFAKQLQDMMMQGPGRIVFVIGGSLGLSPDVLARSNERLSLSDMTLAHQLSRVVLLEQVYRAFRILHNEPYHK